MQLKGSKRRIKRKEGSDNSSDEDFTTKKTQKKPKKTEEAPKITGKIVKPRKNKQDQFGFSESDEEVGAPAKAAVVPEKKPKPGPIKVGVEIFSADKVFSEILNRANKEPQFLIMIKNLLSDCYRNLEEKKAYISRKWKQLYNSNYPPDEYRNRELELRKKESQEIPALQMDIMKKLSFVSIRGFETREGLIEEYRAQHSQASPEAQFFVDDAVWDKYHEQQLKLLAQLLKEKDFVSQNYATAPMRLQPTVKKDLVLREHEALESEMMTRFNSLEAEENPQSTQFLFCKNFKEVNLEKVFQDGFSLSEQEKFYLDSKALSWLLDSKSDEIYTNEKFQKETFERYSAQLKSLYQHGSSLSDEELMNTVLEITAYMLNSVHYFQKFKLKCELLHPLDLLLVIEKIKKEWRKSKRNEETSRDNLEEWDSDPRHSRDPEPSHHHYSRS